MKPIAFYESCEKGEGWLHVLVCEDDGVQVVIKDDTDSVEVLSAVPVLPSPWMGLVRRASGMWCQHRMGTSSFEGVCEDLGLSRLSQVPWKGLFYVWGGSSDVFADFGRDRN